MSKYLIRFFLLLYSQLLFSGFLNAQDSKFTSVLKGSYSSQYKEISFSGAGSFTVFHAGVGAYLQDHKLASSYTYIGASGGAIIAALLAMNYDMYKLLKIAIMIFKTLKKSIFRQLILGRTNDLFLAEVFNSLTLQDFKNGMGRCTISVFDLTKLKRKYIHSFESLNELYDSVRASTYIPIINWHLPPKVQDIFIPFDGAFLHMQPIINEKETITVNPFAFYSPDIGGSFSFFHSFSLFSEEEARDIFSKGYLAAKRFFEKL